MASFSVVSNVSAINAQANLTVTNLGLQRALTGDAHFEQAGLGFVRVP